MGPALSVSCNLGLQLQPGVTVTGTERRKGQVCNNSFSGGPAHITELEIAAASLKEAGGSLTACLEHHADLEELLPKAETQSPQLHGPATPWGALAAGRVPFPSTNITDTRVRPEEPPLNLTEQDTARRGFLEHSPWDWTDLSSNASSATHKQLCNLEQVAEPLWAYFLICELEMYT